MSLVRKPFVYMRHGETAWNDQQRICGSSDIPLNLRGEEQAKAAAEWLAYEWSQVISSQLGRARTTAALAVPHQQALADARFNERDFGLLEGAPILNQPLHRETPKGGESWDGFVGRVVAAVNDALVQYPMPLLIAHGSVYRVLFFQMFGTPDCTPLKNATPLLIQPLGDQGWVVTELARVSADTLQQLGLKPLV